MQYIPPTQLQYILSLFYKGTYRGLYVEYLKKIQATDLLIKKLATINFVKDPAFNLKTKQNFRLTADARYNQYFN
jgi:hypothetical protein